MMTLKRVLSATLSLCLLAIQIQGYLFQYPKRFIYLDWLRATTDGNTLFLDGGEVHSRRRNGSSETGVLACTIYIDLTKAWNNRTVELKYFQKPIDFPFTRFPVLWLNPVAGQVQNFAGWWYDGYDGTDAWICDGSREDRQSAIGPTSPNLPRPWMWSLSYGNNFGWARSDSQPGGHIQPMRGSLVAQSPHAVYALGTWSETYNWADEFADRGLLVYDFAQRQWQNRSSMGYGFEHEGYAAMGEAVYTDVFGDQGVIVYLSGYKPPGEFGVFDGNSGNLQRFAQLYIYDIASKTFFTQSTSGRIPLPRWAFCSVGVSENGTNSFDIFIYGGFTGDGFDESPLDSLETVYVLSLPSFVWTEIPLSSAGARGAHACEVIGQRQMIVFGGRDPTQSTDNPITDPWNNAMNIFDLSDWRWTNGYNPRAAPYKKNPELAKLNAKTTYPRSWDSHLARSIFRARPSSKPSNKHSDKHFNKPSGSSRNIGAIIGGVIGGVLVSFFIIFAWFRYRRRKGRALALEDDESSKPEVKHDGAQYAPVRNNWETSYNVHHELEANETIFELAPNEKVHELDGKRR